MRLPTPAWPELPSTQQAEHPVPLRFEDLAQDGRLLVSSMGPLYGAVAWRELLEKSPVAEVARAQGVVPILTRLSIDGAGGPFSPANPMATRAGYDLSHSVDERGEVARLHLQIWAEARGPKGHAYEHLAERGGEAIAGRVYAEHVFTRLFAAPSERKVLRLDLPGMPPVPAARIEPLSVEALLALPEGAEPLGPPEIDPVPALFSLGHSDGNQHVNSLIYPRIFEDFALRKIRLSGARVDLLARQVDCLFRKPFFAGDAALVRLQVFRLGDRFGAAGVFLPEAEGAAGRPSVAVRLSFERLKRVPLAARVLSSPPCTTVLSSSPRPRSRPWP